MKLFVDDLRSPPSGWEIARTVSDAIRILATGLVDEISLDHEIRTECCRLVSYETFEPVAYYIKLMVVKPRVRIHTANVAAGLKMAQIIGLDYDNRIYDEMDYD